MRVSARPRGRAHARPDLPPAWVVKGRFTEPHRPRGAGAAGDAIQGAGRAPAGDDGSEETPREAPAGGERDDSPTASPARRSAPAITFHAPRARCVGIARRPPPAKVRRLYAAARRSVNPNLPQAYAHGPSGSSRHAPRPLPGKRERGAAGGVVGDAGSLGSAYASRGDRPGRRRSVGLESAPAWPGLAMRSPGTETRRVDACPPRGRPV
jgi:hypothetical protein